MSTLYTTRRITPTQLNLSILSILCAAMLTGIPAVIQAQSTTEECLEIIRSTYQLLANPPDSGNSCHIQYSLLIKSGETVLPHSLMKVDLTMNRWRMHFLSPQLNIYRDSTHTVSVIPTQQAIKIINVGMKDIRKGQGEMLMMLQDSLFKSFTPLRCTQMTAEDGNVYYRLAGTLDSSLQVSSRVDTLAFIVDPKGKLLRAVHLVQNNPQPVSTELTFEAVDWAYRSTEFETPMLELFLDHTGTLLPRYREYQLIDLRK